MAKSKSGNTLEWDATLSAAQFNRALEELRSGAGRTAKEINAELGGDVIKKIKLETVTDESGARRLVAVEKERLTVVDQIIREQSKLNRISENSVTSLRQQLNQAKQARDEMAKYVSKTGDLSGRLTQINSQWVSQNQRVQELTRQVARASASGFWDRLKADLNLGGITNFTSNLVALTQGFQAVSIVVGQFTGAINESVEAVSRLQQFALTFKAIGQGASGGVQALQESSRIALNLGTNINTVREGFQQLSPVVLNSGGTIQDVSNIVEALSSRFAAFGISGDRARRVTNGVIQAFAKGKLQAEELTQQISEADPAFKTDFAKAIGVSVIQLEKLVKTGKITADVLIQKIPLINKTALLYGKLGTSATDAVNSLANGSVTIEQVRNKLASLSQLNLEAFAQSIQPVLVGFLRLQAVVVDFVTNVGKLEATKTVGIVFGQVAQQIGFLVESLLRLTESALIVINPIAKIVNTLLEIPGVAQLVGFALISKVIGPLLQTQKAFLETAKSSGGVFGTLARATDTSLGRAVTSWNGLGSAITKAVQGNKQSIIDSENRTKKLAKSYDTLRIASFSAQQKVSELTQKLKEQRQIQLGGQSTNIAPDIQRTSQQLEQYKGALGRANQKLEETRSALSTTTPRVSALGTAAGAISRSFVGFGATAVSSIRGVFAALGPLTIALAAVSVATAAYRDGTKEYAKEAEQAKARTNALNAALKDLGVGEQSKELSGFSLLWANFSISAAANIQKVIDVFNRFSDTLSGISSGAQQSLGGISKEVAQLLTVAAGAGAGFLIGGPIGAGIGALSAAVLVLASAGGKAAEELGRLQQKATALNETIEIESAATQKLAIEIGKQADAANGNIVVLSKLRQQYRALEDQSGKLALKEQELKKEYDGVTARVKARQDEIKKLRSLSEEKTKQPPGLDAGEKPTKSQQEIIDRNIAIGKARDRIKELEEQLGPLVSAQKLVEASFKNVASAANDAEYAVKKVGERFIGLIKDSSNLQRTISELEESLKGSRQALEDAVPNGEEWRLLTAEIAATELELKRLRDKASDPIILVENTEKAITAINSRIADLNKQKEDIVKGGVIKIELSNKIQEELNDLDQRRKALIQSKNEINIKLNVEQLEFQQQIDSTINKTKLALSKVQLFDQGQLVFGKDAPALAGIGNIGKENLKLFGDNRTFEDFITLGIGIAPEDVQKVQEQIFGIASTIQGVREKLTIVDEKLLNTGLGAKERQELLKDKEKFANELNLAVTEGTIQIAEAGVRLREEIANITRDIRGLKLSNLEFLPPEARQQAIQELNAEVDKIAQRKGLKVNFFGTPEQILQQKQRFVDFYNTLDQKEKERDGKGTALETITKLAEKLKETKFAGEFEKMTAAIVAAQTPLVNSVDFTEFLAKNMFDALTYSSGITEIETPLSNSATSSDTLKNNMIETAKYASEVKQIIENIRWPEVPNPGPGRFAGGPVTAGVAYTVNELGKEMFLSNSGRLSPINARPWSTWRAPSSGTVIPAHIAANLTPSRGGLASSRDHSSQMSAIRSKSTANDRLIRSMVTAITQSGGNSNQNLAAAQASQAIQIGKLTHVVNELVEKEWSVRVNVRNSGEGLSYARAINRMV